MQIMAYLAGFSYSIARGTIRTLTGNERILIPSPDRTVMNFSFCIVYAACLKDTAAKLEQPAELLSFIRHALRTKPAFLCTMRSFALLYEPVVCSETFISGAQLYSSRCGNINRAIHDTKQ